MTQLEGAPKSWPPELLNDYEPLGTLGKGGFGSVWLAQQKTETDGKKQKVAIKLCGSPIKAINKSNFERRAEAGYFHREVNVLKEINHPNIVKLIRAIDHSDTATNRDQDQQTDDCVPYCIVLSYHPGPTLLQMIQHGGALGLPLAREVATKLISAVAHLHGRAVIHRDIKPDNIIISGASLNDAACWSDDIQGERAVKSKRFIITLIDFGLARPLNNEEIQDPEQDQKKLSPLSASEEQTTKMLLRRQSINAPIPNIADTDNRVQDVLNLSSSKSNHKTISNNFSQSLRNAAKKSERGRTLHREYNDQSISHVRVRDLSAVGNRHYAAPEILNGIKDFISTSSRKTVKGGRNKNSLANHIVLAECVSDYGMVVDAYSVGAVLRYMLTGVHPSENINDFIASYKSPAAKLGRFIAKKLSKKNKTYSVKKRFRYHDDLPPEARTLILGLTNWDEKKRTTVRSAKSYEWIANNQNEDSTEEKENSNNNKGQLKTVDHSGHGGTLIHLQCASSGLEMSSTISDIKE